MSAPLRIRPASLKGVTGDDEQLKPYLDRLLKLIPAEVLGLYAVGNGFIAAENWPLLAVWAGFCLLATGLVKAYGTADRPRALAPDSIHVALSMFAFVLWVYSGGGPFVAIGWYNRAAGSLLILGFTFAVPYLYRGQPDA